MLRMVEIELYNYCNRKCDWCPNKLLPERQIYAHNISRDVVLNLITDLKRMKYEGYISFSRYNEPFAGCSFDDNVFDDNDYYYMDLIRCELPLCTLVCNTNGDFLVGNGLIFDPISRRIDELTIMNYDGLSEEECRARLIDWGAEPDTIKKVEKGLYTEYNHMKVLYVNWENWNITNRGGLLENITAEPRTQRCLEPHYFIGVNWDGTVSPCCNIRSPYEVPEHEPFCLGNLKEKSLQEMLNSYTMFRFREQAYHPDKDFGYDLNPCQYCTNCGGRYTRKKGGIMYD